MGVTIINKIQEFAKRNVEAMDRSLNRAAVDIERLAKMQVPHDKGHLLASGRHKRDGLMKYRVEFNKEYARFQEFGGDGKRTVRRYSKPGKKAHYLRDAGKTIGGKFLDYIKQETLGIRV